MFFYGRVEHSELAETTTMQISIFTRSYNSFGGNKHFGLIGETLSRNLRSHGGALNDIEVTAFFFPNGPPRRTLEQSYDNYIRGLEDLPKVRYFKSKRRIDIQYRSRLSEDEYQHNYGPSTPDLIANASNELQESLRLVDDKLKSRSDFDVELFHLEVAQIIRQMPATTLELESLRQRLKEEKDALRKKMDPWDLLDLDWKKFHQQARTILNDVFFWSECDDLSPHGNDTGADLFADFRKWNKRNPQEPAHAFVPKLFKAWGLDIIDGLQSEENIVRFWLEERPDDLVVFDDAMIAAAFASIKVRGYCDPETRILAMHAIRRESLECVTTYRGWRDVTERIAALEKMKRVIQTVPETAL